MWSVVLPAIAFHLTPGSWTRRPCGAGSGLAPLLSQPPLGSTPPRSSPGASHAPREITRPSGNTDARPSLLGSLLGLLPGLLLGLLLGLPLWP
jgi:hypothetical protein